MSRSWQNLQEPQRQPPGSRMMPALHWTGQLYCLLPAPIFPNQFVGRSTEMPGGYSKHAEVECVKNVMIGSKKTASRFYRGRRFEFWLRQCLMTDKSAGPCRVSKIAAGRAMHQRTASVPRLHSG